MITLTNKGNIKAILAIILAPVLSAFLVGLNLAYLIYYSTLESDYQVKINNGEGFSKINYKLNNL